MRRNDYDVGDIVIATKRGFGDCGDEWQFVIDNEFEVLAMAECPTFKALDPGVRQLLRKLGYDPDAFNGWFGWRYKWVNSTPQA